MHYCYFKFKSKCLGGPIAKKDQRSVGVGLIGLIYYDIMWGVLFCFLLLASLSKIFSVKFQVILFSLFNGVNFAFD